ncbi:MAG TPA: hypothetical protein VFX31_08495 [Ktedonobacterales bacterium]|nr:hypothetical protein [Ktedonobacterales bacterium]
MALVVLLVVALGASYWAYINFRDEYPYRSAIQLDSVAMTGGGAGWAVGEIGGKPNTLDARRRWPLDDPAQASGAGRYGDAASGGDDLATGWLAHRAEPNLEA